MSKETERLLKKGERERSILQKKERERVAAKEKGKVRK